MIVVSFYKLLESFEESKKVKRLETGDKRALTGRDGQMQPGDQRPRAVTALRAAMPSPGAARPRACNGPRNAGRPVRGRARRRHPSPGRRRPSHDI
jgi:hypothetical protein